MRYTIIGFGKLGSAIAKKLIEKGEHFAIVSKHLSQKLTHQNLFNQNVEIFNSVEKLEEPTDVTFITTNDSMIPKVAKDLVARFGNKIKNKTFIHCSGIYSDEILYDIEKCGGFTASAHPLQTFFEYTPDIFEDIFWIVQSNHFEKIKLIVEQIGGTALEVHFDEKTRAIYHASAVVASNFLNSLLLFSKQLINLTNLEPNILIPLINRTIQNNLLKFEEIGFTPKTGPIVRGDFGTILHHLEGLQQHKELKEVYTILCLAMSKLALINKDISEEIFATFEKILNKTFS
ncbi:MAG: DUF2520 domain-containing protein [Candidatus Kapaibacteriota bacterium]|jgi:predicted short-subunit dehydrogenase-like oxidoreductase (DUF2520 family)